MESETEENPDDQDYILSILRNLQSPNRFPTGNPINNCASVISGNTYSDEDSNTNDSSSNFSTNGELSDEQLVENFNRVRTGHRLDDYILSILNNGKCKKKSHIQSTVDSLDSIHCSDLTLKPFENAFSPGSLEVSNILFKEDSSNHKLDEVLHVAMKIVKPKKGKTTKPSNVSSPCKRKSPKSTGNCTKMKKQTTHSASNLTCHVCNFVFNSEESRNRHMSNEHIKRVSNKNQCGNRKRNLSQSENFPSETSNCSTTTWCFYAFPQEEEHVREDFEKEQFSMVNLKELPIDKTVIDPNTIGETKDVEKGEGSLRTSSYRQFLNSSEDQCSRIQPFSEHVKIKHKRYMNGESNCIETGVSQLQNRSQFDKLLCDSDFQISLPKHKPDLRPSSLLSKLCSSIQILDKSEQSPSSSSPLSSTSSLSSSAAAEFKLQSNQQSSSSTLSSNQQPPSTSNPVSPAVLIPDTVLRERHWIILDTPNIFCAPSSSSTTIKVKGHQNQTQNDDIVGIKSILDDPVKAPSLTQCLTLFPECLSRSASPKSNTCSKFNIENECSANSIINQAQKFPFVEKSNSQSESCTVNVSATQESDHIENDEIEIIKHSCARHLAFSDYIARYYAFKTHRAGSSSSKEDKVSTFKDTSKEAVYNSPFSRDFILSPPKKRWKSYLGNE